MSEHDPLEVLLELTRTLAEPHGLEDALTAVTDAALDLLPADHASIRLLDVSGSLLAGARSGVGVARTPLVFRPGEGVAGWVVDRGVPVRVADTRTDPRFASKPDQGFVIVSLLAVPLWSGGKIVGVLSTSAQAPGAFSEKDEALARLLANCCIPPIERARLQRLAITDPHTRAYNRRYLAPRLQDEVERARCEGTPLSLLLMDLDHFKRVNDTYGHSVGDEVLLAFADRTRHQVRQRDILVRRGGEEFVLVMPETAVEEAALVAERIRKALARDPIRVASGTIPQTVSIGVAAWDGSEDPADLERRADEAMYRAKRAGRDRVEVDR